jgi:hypothetical protein
VSRPDVHERRRLLKASKRQRKQERVQRAEAVLSETGIRRLRREPVFDPSKLFAPVGRRAARGRRGAASTSSRTRR